MSYCHIGIHKVISMNAASGTYDPKAGSVPAGKGFLIINILTESDQDRNIYDLTFHDLEPLKAAQLAQEINRLMGANIDELTP